MNYYFSQNQVPIRSGRHSRPTTRATDPVPWSTTPSSPSFGSSSRSRKDSRPPPTTAPSGRSEAPSSASQEPPTSFSTPVLVLYTSQGQRPLETLTIQSAAGSSAGERRGKRLQGVHAAYDRFTRSQLLCIPPQYHVSFLPVTPVVRDHSSGELNRFLRRQQLALKATRHGVVVLQCLYSATEPEGGPLTASRGRQAAARRTRGGPNRDSAPPSSAAAKDVHLDVEVTVLSRRTTTKPLELLRIQFSSSVKHEPEPLRPASISSAAVLPSQRSRLIRLPLPPAFEPGTWFNWCIHVPCLLQHFWGVVWDPHVHAIDQIRVSTNVFSNILSVRRILVLPTLAAVSGVSASTAVEAANLLQLHAPPVLSPPSRVELLLSPSPPEEPTSLEEDSDAKPLRLRAGRRGNTPPPSRAQNVTSKQTPPQRQGKEKRKQNEGEEEDADAELESVAPVRPFEQPEPLLDPAEHSYPPPPPLRESTWPPQRPNPSLARRALPQPQEPQRFPSEEWAHVVSVLSSTTTSSSCWTLPMDEDDDEEIVVDCSASLPPSQAPVLTPLCSNHLHPTSLQLLKRAATAAPSPRVRALISHTSEDIKARLRGAVPHSLPRSRGTSRSVNLEDKLMELESWHSMLHSGREGERREGGAAPPPVAASAVTTSAAETTVEDEDKELARLLSALDAKGSQMVKDPSRTRFVLSILEKRISRIRALLQESEMAMKKEEEEEEEEGARSASLASEAAAPVVLPPSPAPPIGQMKTLPPTTPHGLSVVPCTPASQVTPSVLPIGSSPHLQPPSPHHRGSHERQSPSMCRASSDPAAEIDVLEQWRQSEYPVRRSPSQPSGRTLRSEMEEAFVEVVKDTSSVEDQADERLRWRARHDIYRIPQEGRVGREAEAAPNALVDMLAHFVQPATSAYPRPAGSFVKSWSFHSSELPVGASQATEPMLPVRHPPSIELGVVGVGLKPAAAAAAPAAKRDQHRWPAHAVPVTAISTAAESDLGGKAEEGTVALRTPCRTADPAATTSPFCFLRESQIPTSALHRRRYSLTSCTTQATLTPAPAESSPRFGMSRSNVSRNPTTIAVDRTNALHEASPPVVSITGPVVG